MDGRIGTFELMRAGEAELDFVMATERIEGYEALVGRSTEAQHRACLADGRHAYFVGQRDGVPVGFVIIRDWQSWDGVALVKRIAVTRPGQGNGSALLRRAVDRIFEDTNCWRLAIGLFPTNLRARRTYEGAGFRVEGIARGTVFYRGEHHDELVMALLRPDWEAARTPSSPRAIDA